MQLNKLNLPNKLTVLRLILVIPLLILATIAIFLYHDYHSYLAVGLINILILVVFLAAMCTDYLDGKIARERNLVTDFGKLWDPIADKVVTNIVLIYLTVINFIPFPILMIFILRDLVVAGFRNVMTKHNISVAADKWGKLKTLLLCIGISLSLLSGSLIKMTVKEFWGLDYIISLLISLPITLAAILSLYSGYVYYKKVKPFILTK